MTLGDAWIGIASAILKGGMVGTWEGLPILELFRATLEVRSPTADDPIIAQHGDPERLGWMHANFTDRARLAALGDSDSYATRLYDYAHTGRDQIRWVIERIAANPSARDATVTTFQPATDTSYIPCVSLLDFWLHKGALQLEVYAHSIDFGTKGYANLVELAVLQTRVAGELDAAIGTLTMSVKSAHIYETELGTMRRIVAAAGTTKVGGSDAPETAFASVADLSSALRRAEAAHAEHEKRTGRPDANWPDWYAAYIAAEQAGEKLPI